MIRKLMARKPLANPIPNTDPTTTCVVDIGNPKEEAAAIVIAELIPTEKPRDGVNSVIFFPIVSITRQPHVANPQTKPSPPKDINTKRTFEE
ncbi:Uncharacterised protein [Chlamydia trachomatis]|nr:Uncharacterised protein [Chlamydia trachomatis]